MTSPPGVEARGGTIFWRNTDRIVVFFGTTWAGFTLLGLILANAGGFNRGSVALAFMVSLFAGATTAKFVPGNREIHAPSTTAMIIAIGLTALFVLWGIGHSGEHVITDRDPGVYASTSIWLVEHGNLRVGFGEGALDLPDGFTSRTLGYVAVGDAGDLQPGFMHGLVAWLSASALFLGTRSIFWFNVLVGAAAGWMLMVLAIRLGMKGIYPVVVLALSLFNPITLFVVRDVFSEPSVFLMVAIVAYSLVAIRSSAAPSWPMMVMSGLVVGSTTLFRLDGPIYLIGWSAALLLLVVGSEDRRGSARSSAAAWIVAAVTVAIAWSLATNSAPEYIEAHRDLAVPLLAAGMVALVLGFAATIVVGSVPALGRAARRALAHPFLPVFAAVVIIGGALWYGVGRPILTTDLGSPPSFIPPIVEAELAGATPLAFNAPSVDPARTYFEQSGLWQIRYWGAAAIVAALGAIVVVVLGRTRIQQRWAIAALSLLLLIPLLLYLQRPSITPDHFWAMRRYAPFTIPAISIFAVFAVSGFDRLLQRADLDVGVRRLVVALTMLVVMWTPIARSIPLAGASEYVGFISSIHALCDELPDNGAIVMVSTQFREKLQAPVRAMCDVPVIGTGDHASSEDVRAAVDALTVAGYTPVLLAQGDRQVGTPPIARDVFVYRVTEWTVTEPPRRQVAISYSWAMYAASTSIGS